MLEAWGSEARKIVMGHFCGAQLPTVLQGALRRSVALVLSHFVLEVRLPTVLEGSQAEMHNKRSKQCTTLCAFEAASLLVVSCFLFMLPLMLD